jgi:hypothetical protein
MYVTLIKPASSTCTGKRHIPVGTRGEVIATRASDKGGLDYLVKFVGYSGPRSLHQSHLATTTQEQYHGKR